MTAAQIEKLYIAHAADFQELLNDSGSVMAKIDDQGYYLTHSREWRCVHLGTLRNIILPVTLAISAMTESWRERLGRKHGLQFHTSDGVVEPWRVKDGKLHQLWAHGQFVETAEPPRNCHIFSSMAEAICAAVKALAAEKRASNLTLPQILDKLDEPRKAVLADVKRTLDAGEVKMPTGGTSIAQQFIDANDNRLRKIIREELDRYLRGRIVDPRKDPQ